MQLCSCLASDPFPNCEKCFKKPNIRQGDLKDVEKTVKGNNIHFLSVRKKRFETPKIIALRGLIRGVQLPSSSGPSCISHTERLSFFSSCHVFFHCCSFCSLTKFLVFCTCFLMSFHPLFFSMCMLPSVFSLHFFSLFLSFPARVSCARASGGVHHLLLGRRRAASACRIPWLFGSGTMRPLHLSNRLKNLPLHPAWYVEELPALWVPHLLSPRHTSHSPTKAFQEPQISLSVVLCLFTCLLHWVERSAFSFNIKEKKIPNLYIPKNLSRKKLEQ